MAKKQNRTPDGNHRSGFDFFLRRDRHGEDEEINWILIVGPVAIVVGLADILIPFLSFQTVFTNLLYIGVISYVVGREVRAYEDGKLSVMQFRLSLASFFALMILVIAYRNSIINGVEHTVLPEVLWLDGSVVVFYALTILTFVIVFVVAGKLPRNGTLKPK